MRLLFEIDKKDYVTDGTVTVRDSARSIIISDGKLAMIHSLKYDYYKFPGGGIEKGESRTDALIRETLEETGLNVIPESIKEYGYVHRVQKDDTGMTDIFVQDNYYYFCSVLSDISEISLDDYEADERFTLEFVTAETVIKTNSRPNSAFPDKTLVQRDMRVTQLLLEEQYLLE